MNYFVWSYLRSVFLRFIIVAHWSPLSAFTAASYVILVCVHFFIQLLLSMWVVVALSYYHKQLCLWEFFYQVFVFCLWVYAFISLSYIPRNGHLVALGSIWFPLLEDTIIFSILHSWQQCMKVTDIPYCCQYLVLKIFRF